MRSDREIELDTTASFAPVSRPDPTSAKGDSFPLGSRTDLRESVALPDLSARPLDRAADSPTAAGSPATRRRRLRLYRSTWAKHLVVGCTYGAQRVLPSFCFRGLVRSLWLAARATEHLPGNLVATSCGHLARLARARGLPAEGGGIYRRLVDQSRLAGEILQSGVEEGPDAVIPHTEILPADGRGLTAEGLDDQLARHGGAMLAIPHNIGGAISGIAFSRRFPSLLLGKNGSTPWRAAIADDVFARMGIEPLLVRGQNPLSVTRRIRRALREGTAVVATVDNIYRKANRIDAPVFGGSVGFSPWAARLAADAAVPMIPAYIALSGRDRREYRVSIRLGPPLLGRDLDALTAHYVGAFEEWILRDPASWAFVAHKRWRMVLRQACARLDAPTDLTPFEVRSRQLRLRER